MMSFIGVRSSTLFIFIGVFIVSLGLLDVLQTPNASAAQIYLPLVARGEPPASTLPTSTPGTIPSTTASVWVSHEEIAALPTSGPAWEHLKATADEDAGTPDLSDQDTNANVNILAKALVYARTGEQQYQNEVVTALEVITLNDTEEGGRTLALGRELGAYVIAADLIDLADHDPTLDAQFRGKLRELLTKPLEGWGSDPRTLQETHELRPNNWGTHAGAARAAVAVYLGDTAELERTARVFHGYLGDLSAYNGFEYGDDLSWQADPEQPVGINPAGAVKDGHSIDGALPEEMRRGGEFQWPPLETNYPWEGLQGALLQADILHRAGYPAWDWEDQALLRAAQFLYDIGWEPEGDDEWIPWLINEVYHTSFATDAEAQPGKNIGWTHWIYP